MERFKLKWLTFILTIVFIPLFANSKKPEFQISGFVWDFESGEALIGANVLIVESFDGVATDQDGYFQLSSSRDSLQLIVKYLGYEEVSTSFHLDSDTVLQISLKPIETRLNEVVVNNDGRMLNNGNSSLQKINMETIDELPTFMGEQDIMKILQFKPGISSGSEASSGLFVRGGKSGQNLFLVDGMEIYNPTHLFGFFSIFNPDVLRSVQLYKGDFPASFGGRTSSAIDIEMKKGNEQKLSGSGGVGLISSRLTLEVPMVKNKSSLIISGRRTYADIFTEEINQQNKNNEDFQKIPKYFFYDLNAKYHYRFNDKHQFFISSYFGRDDLNFQDQTELRFLMNWGNRLFSINSQHQLNDKLFLSNSMGYTGYSYNVETLSNYYTINLQSNINDWVVKSDLSYDFNKNHSLSAGIKIVDHQFHLNQLESDSEGSDMAVSDGQIMQAREYAAYLSDYILWKSVAELEAGIRLSAFSNQKTFAGIEPRFNVVFLPRSKINFKAGYSEAYQYVHLLSNSGVSLPTDFWHPSNEFIEPQHSRQVSAGINYQLGDDYIISNEGYYRSMSNMIDFKDGGRIFVNKDLSEELVTGKGWSYGNEFYLEKQNGNFTGWLSYTLAWTWRQFDDINEGRKFPGRNDIRHEVSTVLQYKVSPKFSLSANWIYATGNVTTLPVGRFLYQGVHDDKLREIPVYQERNTFRLRDYHRLDLGIKYSMQHRWGESYLQVGAYNIYNRRNPYHIYFIFNEDTPQGDVPYSAKQLSLFPIIPSLTYSFKF